MKTFTIALPLVAVAIAVFAPAFGFDHAPKKVKDAEPSHLTMANDLVNGILDQAADGTFTDADGNQTNRYGGAVGTYSITFTNPNDSSTLFTNYSRCAPFWTQLFKAAYGWTPPKAMGNSPDPKKYFNAIDNSINGFTKRTDFSTWQPGDLLASPYYDTTTNIGHVMILINAVQTSYDAATQTREYNALVVDSSGDLHSSDTRTLYAGLNQGGVGRGIIRIRTVDNVITQWAWSLLGNYYSATGRPMTIGTINQ